MSTSSGSSGSDILTAAAAGGNISAGAGNDTVLGGAGSDRLNGDAGDDTLVYNVTQNAGGTTDIYTGGSGIDTLLIEFTLLQWLDGATQAQVANYLAHLAARANANTGQVSNGSASDFVFRFGASTLTIQMNERLRVTVDGVEVDPRDAQVIAANDVATVAEDGPPVTVNVLLNDSVPDLVKDIVLVTGPGHGTATLVKPNPGDASTWRFQYSADAAFCQHLGVGQTATDTFTYRVTDANSDISTATVTITITGTNDGPVAVSDTSAGTENQTLTIDVLANDTDADDGHVFTLVSASAPAGKGTASVVASQLSFNPGTDFDHLAQGIAEVVTVSYTMQDEHGASSSSTVTITVTGTNDGPVAVADTAAGTENQTLMIDVLANDTDADDGHVFTLVSATAPAGKGSASVIANQLSFNPGTDFDHLAQGITDVVTVSYSMQDEHGASSSSAVTITVTGTNDGPLAAADTAAGTENQTLTIDVLANDADADDGHVFTLVSATAPAGKGTASVVSNQLSFDPGPDFDHLAQGITEVVTVSYTMQDEHAASSSSAVTITVTGTNDGPVAVADTAAGTENQTLTIDVLANDTDADNGHVFTLVSATASAGKGTASVVANQLSFNPGTDFDHLAQGIAEVVTVSYSMRDEHGALSSSTVTITVTGTNDSPIAAADTAAGTENQTLTIDVLANDTDADDGHVFTLVSASAPAGKGTASVVANQLSFNPGTDFDHLAQGATEQVTVSYSMQDEHGASSNSTATITVTGTNDAPVVDLNGPAAGNDAVAVATEQAPQVLAAAATMTDIDSATLASLTVTLTTRPDGDSAESLSLDAAATAAAAGLAVSYTAATGVLSVSGSATKAAYEQILRGVRYTNTSDAPAASARSVTVVVSDGIDAGASRSVSLTVTPVNDGPVATITPTSYSSTEQVALNLKNTGLSVSDVDAGSGALTAVLSVTQGSLTVSAGGSGAGVSGSGSASVTITGTLAQINSLLATDATSVVSYVNGSDTPGATATLTLQVSDNGNTGGGALAGSDTATINIAALNDAPTGTDKTIALVEDVTYTLADFGFQDVEGDAFAGVVIVTLPSATAGVLRLGNAAIAAGTFVTAASIADGMLVYTPLDDVFGAAGDTSFTFAVRDAGATGGGNVNQDATPNTMTLDMSSTDFPDTNSTSNITITLTGPNESIEDNGTGNGDSINLDTAAGGATTFTALNFFRADNNMEMSWTQAGQSRTVTGIDQYSPSAYENFNSFDDGGTFAGFSLGNAAYVLAQTNTGSASRDIIAGTAGADTISGGAGTDLLFGNGGDDQITGGAGADLMAGGLGNDVFIIATSDSPVTLGGSGNGGTLAGHDVIADFLFGTDTLDLQGSAASAPNATVDGTNSTLTIAGNQVAAHTIANGLITFDDANVFAAPLSLTGTSQVAAVVQYLQANDIGNAGSTVAFVANVAGVAHTYVYEQLSAGAAGSSTTNSILVDLAGVTLASFAGLGLS